jgi:predicted RNA polymerase sigma factor
MAGRGRAARPRPSGARGPGPAGEDFDAAEDALQEALLEALRAWPEHPARDPRAWLATVATRRLVDARRGEAARHRREEAASAEPRPAATEEGDDTLFLLFCCCHPTSRPPPRWR